jgi:hypothetical protein
MSPLFSPFLTIFLKEMEGKGASFEVHEMTKDGL